MKYKKILIFICLIICLFNIASVCASDVNETMVASEDQSDELITINDITTTEDGTLSKTPGTFTELATKINTGTKIVLDKDYKFNASVDENYKNGVEISKTITLDGKGHTIEGNCEELLYISGENIVLKNLIFTNTLSSSTKAQGSLFIMGSNCLIDNCSFINSNVRYGTSAIYNMALDLTIINSYFANNYARTDGQTIVLMGKDCHVENCSFINNTALSGSGGAIMLCADDSVIKNCKFIDNVAQYAGAIDWSGNNGILTNCSFISNSATLQTSAIDWTGHLGILNESYFINHPTEESDSEVIYWSGDEGVLAESYFINNLEKPSTAIKCYNEYFTLDKCIFINNTVPGNIKGHIIKRQSEMICSNYSFDYNHIERVSIKINNTLSIAPINSPINFIFINGNIIKKFKTTAVNDVASLFNEISDLSTGDWIVTAVFEGDDNYNSCNGTFMVIINPTNSYLNINPVRTSVNHETSLIANIYDYDTLPITEGIVTFFYDGINIGAGIVNNGVASLSYTPSSAGTHVISATYIGNNYISSYTTLTVSIDKENTQIISSNVNTVYNGDKYLTATLRDMNGNVLSGLPVSINIAGVGVKTLKTDANGQVKLSTNNLAPPCSYATSITFAGDSNFNGDTAYVSISVTHATPKLTAKAKTFKVKDKTKKYTVTLKTNKNVAMKNTKITLKVNGKTYSAKTNAKGVATFKLTKLTKKGKFTAVVKYAGNAYYNAKSVKPKITVK